MVVSTGVLLRRPSSLVPHMRQLRVSILLINWCPRVCPSLVFLLYLYHSSLVIEILIFLVGLKDCRLRNQSLGMGWTLSKVVTPVVSEEELLHPSPPHKLGMPSWSGYQEHYTTQTKRWMRNWTQMWICIGVCIRVSVCLIVYLKTPWGYNSNV